MVHGKFLIEHCCKCSLHVHFTPVATQDSPTDCLTLSRRKMLTVTMCMYRRPIIRCFAYINYTMCAYIEAVA